MLRRCQQINLRQRLRSQTFARWGGCLSTACFGSAWEPENFPVPVTVFGIPHLPESKNKKWKKY
jgi:hypothetical protein